MFRAKLVRTHPAGGARTSNPIIEDRAAAADPGPGVAPSREIDGVTFTGTFALYEGTPNGKYGFGAPTEKQLAADDLIIETLSNEPWPGSARDRFGRGSGQNRMLLAMHVGTWPTQKERDLQAEVSLRAKDRVAYATEKLMDRGMQPHEVEGIVRATVTPIVRREEAARPARQTAAKPSVQAGA